MWGDQHGPGSSLRNSIGYIRELKEFHRKQEWDVCLNMYQIVRASLEHIRKRLPEQEASQRRKGIALHWGC